MSHNNIAMNIKKEPLEQDFSINSITDLSECSQDYIIISSFKTEEIQPCHNWPTLSQDTVFQAQEQQVVHTFGIKQETNEMLMAYDEYEMHEKSLNNNAPSGVTTERRKYEGSGKELGKDRAGERVFRKIHSEFAEKNPAVSETEKQIDNLVSGCKSLRICLEDVCATSKQVSDQTSNTRGVDEKQKTSCVLGNGILQDCECNKNDCSDVMSTTSDELNQMGGNLYENNFCRKALSRRTTKESHENTHTGKMSHSYSRPTCEKSLTQLLLKNSHECIHMEKKAYSCSYCEKSFGRLSLKIKHERVHTREKPYSYSYCEKSFFRSSHKITHERIHTGEKPYPCGYCEKWFARLSHKNTHELIHTGERPYSCSYCEKSFIDASSKKSHERIHTREKAYSCSFCEKSFGQLSLKVRHERIHTGEKPYSCSYCEKSFSQASSKNIHERIHTRGEPYSCSYCEKSFTLLANKNCHERFHSREKPYSCIPYKRSFTHMSRKICHERFHK